MTFIPPTRKRSRSSEEEDFLPLSKKINNLHINNWGNFENPPDHLLPWSNATKQWLSSQHSLLLNRHHNESNDSSPFENAQENFHNSDKTEVNEHFGQLNEDSYQNNSFYQLNFPNGEKNSQETAVPSNWSTYSPDLSVDENPHYYENNKLLFELYVARLQRGGY